MSDAISKTALLAFANNHVGGTIDCNDIARFPTMDVAPVVHGHWQYDTVGSKYSLPSGRCSVCGAYSKRESNFCPCCGAKMDRGDNGE